MKIHTIQPFRSYPNKNGTGSQKDSSQSAAKSCNVFPWLFARLSRQHWPLFSKKEYIPSLSLYLYFNLTSRAVFTEKKIVTLSLRSLFVNYSAGCEMKFRDFEICCELSVTKSVNCKSVLHSWFGGVIFSGALRPEKKIVLI